MPDLLPCPFCGCDRVRGYNDNAENVMLECDNCHANLLGVDFDKAREFWNRRVPYLPPEDVETLRRFEAHLRDFCASGEHGNLYPDRAGTVEIGCGCWMADKIRAILAKVDK